jgi:hypothetical protein
MSGMMGMTGCLAADMMTYCFCCCFNWVVGAGGLDCGRAGGRWREQQEQREGERERRELEENSYHPERGELSDHYNRKVSFDYTNKSAKLKKNKKLRVVKKVKIRKGTKPYIKRK